jgi:glucose/arabinose dehydrogenase
MLVGGMSGRRLVRLRVDGDEVTHEETLLRGVGRIREVVEGPEGHVWITIDGGARWEDGPPTKIYRLEPAGRR